MSAQLMRRDRPAFEVASTDGGSTDQTVAATRGHLAYSGPLDVDEQTHTVHHHVVVSPRPNWIGGSPLHEAAMHDGLLVPSGDVAHEYGDGAVAALTWQRTNPIARRDES